MKIIDLTLTLFKWEGIPVGLAKRHTGRIGGDSQIGLLAISTDEGIKGHSFLGWLGAEVRCWLEVWVKNRVDRQRLEPRVDGLFLKATTHHL